MLIEGWQWWSFRSAIAPVLATIISFIYAIYILAYPPVHKKLSMFLLAIPVFYAFTYHLSIAPDYMLSDTFGRFLYIWYGHMSYEVTILEFAPALGKENDNWKTRVKLAWRVLFDRNHKPPPAPTPTAQELKRKDSAQPDSADTTITTPPHHPHHPRQPKMTHTPTGTHYHHNYTYLRFTAHHLTQLILLISLLTLHDQFRSSRYGPPSHNNSQTLNSFFRRLPLSLHASELYHRAHVCFEWTIISLFEYEFYYSLFALLFVSILRTDTPSQWPLSLCGHINTSWSMRQYWGRHWHNYIYRSFTAHTQVVTRRWLGCKRGALGTRLLENTIVFAVSGVMHSLVKRVQDPGGEMWAITWWYVAQMVPIVVEGVVQHYWKKGKKWMGVEGENKWVARGELAVGYVWVAWWFMWSVPKYSALKDDWTMKRMLRRWEKEHGALEKMSLGNETE
ncbi:hypothetical protein T440DRAFT_482170 [Plenodomus tracheiphilus IPT5]|uniref:Wax synthase domain-containing protein n=1 Tax=Plenodomus tracheiphilus IPT5 TaxID=1408161 RepID=A0A6A7AVU3_9PLEO|nr:hypothetical protein T440DRAFT_482170 [Plenodomus tracheiphilus IPT5]